MLTVDALLLPSSDKLGNAPRLEKFEKLVAILSLRRFRCKLGYGVAVFDLYGFNFLVSFVGDTCSASAEVRILGDRVVSSSTFSEPWSCSFGESKF